MITSSFAPTRVPVPSPAPIATIGGGFLKRAEPLFLGGVAADHAYSSVADAMSAAAGLSQGSGGSTFAVVAAPHGGEFQLHDVLQPVWQKSWKRQDAFGTERATLEPLEAKDGGRAPKFGFVTKNVDRDGYRSDDAHTGRIKLNADNPATSGVQALVGSSWGYLTGEDRLVDVEATRPPVDPPVPPPVDPPVPPPVDPPVPPTDRTLVEDVTEAVRLASEAARIITTLPSDDTGAEATKADRIKAYKTNMAAQERLERQFGIAGQPEAVVSSLRRSDAFLEDANWQLAKKPSPDGRFNGVDVPGALSDTKKAVDLLNGLLGDLTTGAAA